tara:strand:- start:196 stop:1509 length:1314 start_codon:yes stop_codon:yes gene_type:complete
MKPLNRPMFRYGGPIKEGVMSGIREPLKSGGVALVGNPVYPRTNGREHHNKVLSTILGQAGKVKNFFKKPTAPSGIVATNAATKGGFIPTMATKVKELFRGRQIPTSVAAGGTGTTTGAIVPYGTRVSTGSIRGNLPFGKNPFDNQSILAATQRVLTPATDAIIGTAKAVKPYTGVLTIGGITYSMLKPDGTPKTIEELKVETGADSATIKEKIENNQPKVKTAEELRKEKINKYRDIVDIKGMNKDAAYDSLIAASQLINQSGDFKGDIKSGKLINDIIQATSKQFDKPKATKDAIDTLILKGEIQSDIAAGKPSAIEQQINAISKNLKVDKETATKMFLKQPTDLRSQVTEDAAVMRTIPTHDIIAGATKKQYPNAEILLSDTEVKEKYGDKMSGEDIIKSLDIFKTANDPSGIYVVGKEVIQIDKQGNTNTIFP